MKQDISRRMMMGSLVSVGAAGAAGLASGWNPIEAAAAEPDGVSRAIGEEIRRAVREMSQHPGPGARRFSGSLRLMAAHGRSRGLDASVARQFKDLVATQGREAVIMGDPDWAFLRAQAPAYGVDRFTPSPVDVRARSRALDAVLAGRFTDFLERAAAEVDARSRVLDRMAVPGLRQVADPSAGCQATMEMETWASMLTRVICATGVVVGDVSVCVVVTGIYFGIWLANAYDGCH